MESHLNISVEETANTMVVNSKDERIVTVKQLLAFAKVDMSIWEIQKQIVNKYEMGRKAKTANLDYSDGQVTGYIRDTGQIHVEPLIQVKVWLIRKSPIAISPAISPVKIQPTPTPTPKRKSPQDLKRALILPDTHFGFTRDMATESLEPFHDRKAMDIALQYAEDAQPDIIVFLGDTLDLPDWTDKFLRSPEFYWCTQPAIIEAAWWLGEFRITCPDAKIFVLEGNHDQRMENSLIKHLISAYQLKAADRLELPPALSIPSLLALDNLSIKYIDDYPNGRIWLNDRLACAHGSVARQAPGATVGAVARNADVSEIHGHIHRREWATRTLFGRHHSTVVDVFSPGCLCRTDGLVPAKNANNNWQKGFAIVHYTDLEYGIMPVAIENDQAIVYDKVYYGQDQIRQIEQDTNWKLA
jgi:hypothetical protein